MKTQTARTGQSWPTHRHKARAPVRRCAQPRCVQLTRTRYCPDHCTPDTKEIP